MILVEGDINALNQRFYIGEVITPNISSIDEYSMITVCNDLFLKEGVSLCGDIETDCISPKDEYSMINIKGDVNAIEQIFYIGEVKTQKISPIEESNAIVMCADLCMQEEKRIQTDWIEAKDPQDGLIVNCIIPKKRYGFARAHANVNVMIPFIESQPPPGPDMLYDGFTALLVPEMLPTFQGIIPGNLLVEAFPTSHPNSYYFRSPPTLPNCSYSNCYVDVCATVKFDIIRGTVDPGDQFRLTLAKSPYPSLTGNANIMMSTILCSTCFTTLNDTMITETVSMTLCDMVDMGPDEVLELYIGTNSISGGFESMLIGGSKNTKISYEIVSFE
jgi:hypothetical protein